MQEKKSLNILSLAPALLQHSPVVYYWPFQGDASKKSRCINSHEMLNRVRSSTRGAQWLSGRASDSGPRGRGFETYIRRVLSLTMTFYSPKVLVIHRKPWLRPDMTEKLLTGTLNLNTNKQDPRQYTFPCTFTSCLH